MKRALVIGAGIDGIDKAIERAKQGNDVTLIDRFPSFGPERIPKDRIIKIDHGFAKPDINQIKESSSIDFLPYSEVRHIRKENGKYSVRILKKSLRVHNDKCDDCKACIKVCPVNMYDDFNEAVCFRTAVDYYSPGAYNIFKEEMPVCQRTCPINLDIRTYVGLIADGKPLDALRVIREKLPLPGSIGRICPHPCESACNRQYLDEPISICFLKRFVADMEIKENIEPVYETPKEKYEERIAIIGAGPSGLACAYDLARLGYKNITIFEALSVPGGYLWVGIPQYRLPKEILKREVDLILNMGIDIKYNTKIGTDISFEDLRKEYDAIFIGAGCHKGMKLRVPGEDEYYGKGIVDGVAFLRRSAFKEIPESEIKGKLIVVGGGNTAIDSARVAWRLGYDEVYILYRRTRKEMPANPWEVDAAEEEGIKLQYLAAPVEIIGRDGCVVGMKCVKMELGEPDASGRRKPVPIEGSEYVIEAETVVAAIGQRPDLSFLGQDHGIELTRWNTIACDDETGMTNVPGIFAGGDVATGPDIAIRAIAGGKRAAQGIHKYLRSK